VTAAEKSADGVVGGTSFAEGPNAGKTLRSGISNWPSGRKSRSLAFGAARKGEARTALLKGPKPTRRRPLSEPLARTQTKPSVLNPANRRIRTRMCGGVGGEESRDSPLSRLEACTTRSFRDISKSQAQSAPRPVSIAHCMRCPPIIRIACSAAGYGRFCSAVPSTSSKGRPRCASAVGAMSMMRLVFVTDAPASKPRPTAISVGCVS